MPDFSPPNNFGPPIATPDPSDPSATANMPVEVEVPSEDTQDIAPEENRPLNPEFYANLAEDLDEAQLSLMASELVQDYESDKRSRDDWEKAYVKGLEYLGMTVEDRTEPWEGACGVFHPLLTEAAVRFQSQAIIEIFPASGPARTKILGPSDEEKVKQADRVEDEINYILTEQMTEYRSETEQLLLRLPLAGSAFRKIYYDPIEARPCAMMVPAEDFVVNYGASDLKSADRYTHVMKRSKFEVEKLQASGFYRDVALQDPTPEFTEAEKAHDKIGGRRPTLDTDTRHTLLEINVSYDLEEGPSPLPYIITIEKSSQKVLSIYRNWLQEDPLQKKRIHYAHYQYMPGLGFYGIGLVHLVGGLAKSATSLLRQLVDSGTLANLQAGFKTKGLRIKNDGDPLSPGEFRDVDVASGTLSQNILPLPIKEPSATLYNLLGTVVDEGRRIASIADLDVGDMNQQAPVGTTLALLERSMKIMSAIHARLHAALKEELKLIAYIIGTKMPPEYDWDVQKQFNRQQDFSATGRIVIIPVSDPNASTMAQRVVQFQAVMQMATANPEIYNMPLLHRMGLEAMQVKDADKLVPMDDGKQPMDPVSENSGFLNGTPAHAFQEQNHDAHIKSHLAFAMDPNIMEIIGQSPSAQRVRSAIEAHVSEHLAFQYRQQIEKELGTQLPPPDQPLPPEIENQLSGLVADASNRLLYRHQAEAAQKKAEALAQDPVFQLQVRQQDLAEAEFEHKRVVDLAKQTEAIKARESKEVIAGLGMAVDIVKDEGSHAMEASRQVVDAGVRIHTAETQAATQKEVAKSRPKPSAK